MVTALTLLAVGVLDATSMAAQLGHDSRDNIIFESSGTTTLDKKATSDITASANTTGMPLSSTGADGAADATDGGRDALLACNSAPSRHHRMLSTASDAIDAANYKATPDNVIDMEREELVATLAHSADPRERAGAADLFSSPADARLDTRGSGTLFMYAGSTTFDATHSATHSSTPRGGSSTLMMLNSSQRSALDEFSKDGGRAFLHLARKVMLVANDKQTMWRDLLKQCTLTHINTLIPDENVTDEAWNSRSNDDEPDCGELYHGGYYKGILTEWDDECGYGNIELFLIWREDGPPYDEDWEAPYIMAADGSCSSTFQIFCDVSGFVDGNDTDVEVGDEVVFTAEWDAQSGRYTAVDIESEYYEADDNEASNLSVLCASEDDRYTF